jgi:hypothetical protein
MCNPVDSTHEAEQGKPDPLFTQHSSRTQEERQE